MKFPNNSNIVTILEFISVRVEQLLNLNENKLITIYPIYENGNKMG
ncbi:hypothetical protein NEF87_001967 [Candidatus Lokiarchaeum ossiferum]|uniref:Uncharacterized protein n=1 Tax=Candidatus Lokiarchaeum ossiferum TaxID=2951803 RepID=A0ABY6HTI1_9ARCH|nr:hypothetical protein NEF87_001967 [Candidatus Lokiarchaeum sp. B-35]